MEVNLIKIKKNVNNFNKKCKRETLNSKNKNNYSKLKII